MRRGVYGKMWGNCIAAALILTGPTHTFAASADQPAVVGMIEHDFNGFFLLVTNGDGHYDIFQKLDDELGIAENANVVCMPRDMCFLEIAHMPPDVPAAYGQEGHTISGLRHRLAAVRDTYAIMHTVVSEKRQLGMDAWRKAIGELAGCLESHDLCQ